MANDRQPNYFAHTLLRARDWQHRPEFDQVCEWWRGGGRGVCALVGMGGAGKTAIADRFLNELLDENTSTTRERVSPPLPPPNSIFVYSFYDDDKPENFFQHLQIWLDGTSAPEKEKSLKELKYDIQHHQGLIILDGLETVQDSRGLLKLTSPSLYDLLNHIAYGSARELSVLVTSRFPLTDLSDNRPRFFHTIAVEKIDVATGVALLRERGVRGTDMQLAPIVEHCGGHALTVNLAGGYIKEYGDGDSATPLNLGTIEELQTEVDDELDENRRAVLIQRSRLARIAQRYREAMLGSDEAALALLERVCLFRLGVACETLAAIFTGQVTEDVSCKSLASLSAAQLQKKLDGLVHMRILEKSKQSTSSRKTQNSKLKTLYTIHPALRDGLLSGISPANAQASHKAVRDYLEHTLALTIDRNPSDNAVLDLLEDVVYHAIGSAAEDAWKVYGDRIGGFKNLGDRLGQFLRGDRICQMLASSPHPSAYMLKQNDFGETLVDIFLIQDWGLYLTNLGRLDDATTCARKYINDSMKVPSGVNWSVALGWQNLAEIMMLRGRLVEAIKRSEAARRINEKFKMPKPMRDCLALWAHCNAMQGQVVGAIELFDLALHVQGKSEVRFEDSLYGDLAVWQALLYWRLNRIEVAKRITRDNLTVSERFIGKNSYREMLAQLLLVELKRRSENNSDPMMLVDKINERAIVGGANEVLCWAALVKARLELSAVRSQQSVFEGENAEHAFSAEASITEGTKIARDCGYGLYHIDLLLERARLHLLRGDAGGALEDVELALYSGIPAIEETGQVELLAANHKECGYAWAIPAGLQLRAEALLLQAAQEVVSVGWAVPTEEGTLDPIDLEVVGTARARIGQLIGDAKQCLSEALDRWHNLRDPEPTEDNNFIHPETGKEYNYRAAETHQLLVQLEGGILTRFPLNKTEQPNEQSHVDKVPTMAATTSPRVFISYTRDSDEHATKVLQLANRLRGDGIESHLDQYIQNPSEGWPLWMDNEIEAADFVLVVSTRRYATKAKEPKRSGGRFESVLILQDLYEAGMSNDKFIPVVFSKSEAEHILKWLKPVNYYSVDANDGYELLRRRLVNDPAIVPPPVANPVKRGPTNP